MGLPRLKGSGQLVAGTGMIKIRDRHDPPVAPAAAFRQLARRADGAESRQFGEMLVSPGPNLVGDVAYLEGMRMYALLGDEGAHPRHSDEHTVGRQLAQRAVGGHA